ncbi:MAG: fimbria/pilus outer membrane usher protein, partial [Bdellovibrionota bacterium]
LGVVLESNASYTETQAESVTNYPAFTRGDIRLVKDYPTTAVRQSAGDLSYAVRGYQVQVPMGGFQISRDFRLQPTRLTLPSGEHQFFLKTAAKVEVFVNDLLIRTLELPSGRHDIRDFPISTGTNDVRLEITDDVGRKETIQMSFHITSELLSPGTSDYNYSVGIPASQTSGSKTYTPTNPIGSMYHRIGVSNSLTEGVNLQLSKSQFVGGVETIFANRLGAFKFDPAISQVKGAGLGGAIRNRFFYTDDEGTDRTQRSLGLGVEIKTENFSRFSNLVAQTQNLTAVDVSASYNQGLSRYSNGGLSVSFQFNRKFDPSTTNGFRISGQVGRRFDSGLSGNVTFSQTKGSSGITESGISLFLGLSFPKDHQFITGSYDTRSDSTQLGWNYSPENPVGGTSAQVKIDKQRSQNGYSGQVQHQFNRAKLGLLQNSTTRADTTTQSGGGSVTRNVTSNLTSLQLATAFVYAKGHFVLSRTVNDSFVIVTPTRGVKGQTIEINPRPNKSNLGTSDFFGSAVYPEMSSYLNFPLTIGTDKLKPGTMIERDTFLLYPTYKSGFSIEVGTDATVNIAMNLLNPDSTPVSMMGGRVISLSNSSFEPIEVFTNKKGKVRA